MEYGFQLFGMEPAKVRDLAQAAEGMGHDLIVFPDHLVLEGPERQYDPHAMLYDSISIAAIVAEATRKIRVGHLVLCNLFRHPAITAPESRHTRSHQWRPAAGRSWSRMDRDRVPHDRYPVSADQRASCDAR
jgi:Luciferase-like monooxygenase